MADSLAFDAQALVMLGRRLGSPLAGPKKGTMPNARCKSAPVNHLRLRVSV